MKIEIWKDIPGFAKLYQASNFGRIRSLDRKISQIGKGGSLYHRVMKGRIIKPFKNNSGYLTVVLGSLGRGEVHSFVAKTFLNRYPTYDKEVNHLDQNKLNNRIDNLEWVTRSKNKTHSIHLGNHNKVKLTPDQVQLIRRLIKQGRSSVQLAKEFNVHKNSIINIGNGTTWSSL